MLHVVFQPLELLVAEVAQTVALQVDHVHQADEVHAVGVEAVPAVAFGALAEAVEVALAVLLEDVVLAGHRVQRELRARPEAAAAVSNCAGLDRCVMSPVWIMNAGCFGMAAMLPSASCSVAVTLGLAGLSKPRWLSLICTKVKPSLVAASALPIRRERGTPPATVQTMAVPAQVMHFRKPRRCMSPGSVPGR